MNRVAPLALSAARGGFTLCRIGLRVAVDGFEELVAHCTHSSVAITRACCSMGKGQLNERGIL